ncbi:HdeD family acid-resistance protein [Ruegeria intermedia]|uniref:HdeD family acid-resistance protein n=1 Tax=Ruegeria intermedia TaxID=996115 RepID=UPI001CB6E9E2|nr:DUF308 domain-containing protein [Ruegeria intermedia]
MSDWVKWLLMGLLSIVFGIFVLGAPIVASVAVTVVTGALLLISGVLQVVGGFSVEGIGNKILAFIMGAVMLFLGWSFLDHPLQGVLTLATVVMILFIAGVSPGSSCRSRCAARSISGPRSFPACCPWCWPATSWPMPRSDWRSACWESFWASRCCSTGSA